MNIIFNDKVFRVFYLSITMKGRTQNNFFIMYKICSYTIRLLLQYLLTTHNRSMHPNIKDISLNSNAYLKNA